MSKERSNAATSAAHELTITRTFDAPRHLLFEMWTQPEHLRRWSCPHGFSITHDEGDLREGGSWRSCMRSPEGKDLWLGGKYREIVKNELLSFTHAWDEADGQPGPETLVTVRFEDEGTKTRMIFHQAYFDSAANRDGHQGGWNECFERLEVILAQPGAARA